MGDRSDTRSLAQRDRSSSRRENFQNRPGGVRNVPWDSFPGRPATRRSHLGRCDAPVDAGALLAPVFSKRVQPIVALRLDLIADP